MNNFGTFAVLHPYSLLRHLSNCADTTCLQGFSNLITWSIYLEQGTITYATNSVEPFDRLERHLRRLNQTSSETRVQLRMMFEHELLNQSVADNSVSSQPADYQAICWLVEQGHLNTAQATFLIQELVKEIIESFLLIKSGNYTLSDPQQTVTKICRLDVEKTLEYCQIRLHNWQSFAPQISSPNQRPYLLINGINNKNLPELSPELTHWMKGFSLRHLAVIMNQDEIQLAQSLYPHIAKGGMIMHEPDPPYDQLPNYLPAASPFYRYTTELLNRQLIDTVVEPSNFNAQSYAYTAAKDFTLVVRSPKTSTPSKQNPQELTIPNTTKSASQRVTTNTVTTKKTYKIVSVDDSPTILKEISRFLESENFSVVTIDDPLKAVMSIIRHKPDLILLDLNMAGIDGYELCKIIRNNSMFKNTPIIFVTGSKGIVDKVKARLVGASGYLTKPFTCAELLKLVFMHLA